MEICLLCPRKTHQRSFPVPPSMGFSILVIQSAQRAVSIIDEHCNAGCEHRDDCWGVDKPVREAAFLKSLLRGKDSSSRTIALSNVLIYVGWEVTILNNGTR